MSPLRKRMITLTLCSSGTLLASSCATEQILETIFTAFQIVNVWV